MDILKQNAITEEVLRLTDPEQKKRVLKDGMSFYTAQAFKELVDFRLDFEGREDELKKLSKSPEREDKIIALASSEEIIELLRDCLLGLTGPELKRVLYAYVKEIHEFNRLIREAGGRTVVPYEID